MSPLYIGVGFAFLIWCVATALMKVGLVDVGLLLMRGPRWYYTSLERLARFVDGAS